MKIKNFLKNNLFTLFYCCSPYTMTSYDEKYQELSFGHTKYSLTNRHLTAACNAILDNDNKVKSAIFHLSTPKVLWYVGRTYVRHNLEPIAILNKMLRDPKCQLTHLTIDDPSLSVYEIEKICRDLPLDTTLRQINIGEISGATNQDKNKLNELKNSLSEHTSITLTGDMKVILGHGTSYH